ncbi:MAG: hypothetical protein IKO73_06290 [Bacteroidaceae bacterium]|nr:hypothetical protein [Bacteroidaceae bacterium]
MRIFRFISILLLMLISLASVAWGQSRKKDAPKEKAPLLSGVGVGVDLCGLAMKGVGARFANMEICGRVGLKEKFFPIFEIGIGDCTRYGGETTNIFSTRAPYWRVGMDYNVNKKVNGNRFLVGVRYGFTTFNYDFYSPDFVDPVYGTEMPLTLEGQKGNYQWLELCVGFETRLWNIVRLGYNIRYKTQTTQSCSALGTPYFVPGFGKNDSNTFGGSVYLTFDVGKSAGLKGGKTLFGKHKKKKEETESKEKKMSSTEDAPRAAKRRGN